MKAAFWHGIKDIRVKETNVPVAKDGEVLIEVKWCGICGSDLHEYSAGPITIPVGEPHPLTGDKAPLILGHEFAGTVVELGKGATNVKVGDRVAIEPILYCGACEPCKQGLYNLCELRGFHGIVGNGGGFAQYTAIQSRMVHKIPDDMSFEEGATIEPAAVAVQAVKKSQIEIGDTCIVFGAGPIGLIIIQAAKAAGAVSVIAVEVSESRIGKATEAGADHVINPSKEQVMNAIMEITDGKGADICYEVSGAEPAFIQAINAVKPSGEVMIVSLWEKPVSINLNQLVLKECKINSSVGYSHIFPDVIALISSGQINTKSLITKKIHLENIVQDGFETLLNDKSHSKILVHPT